MKNLMIGLAAMASLTLTACGGSICDDAKDTGSHLKEVYESCGIEATDVELTDADIERCEESLDSCTDDDKDKLSALTDCMAEIDDCADKTQAEQQALLGKLITCAAKAQGVSASCSAGVSAGE